MCTRLLHEPQQALPGTSGAPQARKILGAPQARENFEELDRLDAESAVAAASAAADAPTQPQHCERDWESSTHGQVSGSRPSGEAWRPKEGGWRGVRALTQLPKRMGKQTFDSSPVPRLLGPRLTVAAGAGAPTRPRHLLPTNAIFKIDETWTIARDSGGRHG